jgi:hypothetical protein
VQKVVVDTISSSKIVEKLVEPKGKNTEFTLEQLFVEYAE